MMLFSNPNNGKPNVDLHSSNNGDTNDAHESHCLSKEINSTCSTPYVSAPSSPDCGCLPVGYFSSAPTSPMHYVLSTAPRFDSFLSTKFGSFKFEFSSGFSPSGSIGNKEAETPSIETTPSGSTSSSRSSSFGRNSKKWIFFKDLLYRSKSEGKGNKKKFWSSIAFTCSLFSRDEKEKNRKETETKKQKQKQKRSWRDRSKQVLPKKLIAGKPANGVEKRRVPPSAHELHYTANRAQAKEMKKKTFLPYRQGLLGCLGISVCIFECFARDQSFQLCKTQYNVTLASGDRDIVAHKTLPLRVLETSSSNTNKQGNPSSKNKVNLILQGRDRSKQVLPKKLIAGKPANGVEKRRVPPSAHELHYTANRAQAKEMKKKTFLPYRQGLLGCLGISVCIFECFARDQSFQLCKTQYNVTLASGDRDIVAHKTLPLRVLETSSSKQSDDEGLISPHESHFHFNFPNSKTKSQPFLSYHASTNKQGNPSSKNKVNLILQGKNHPTMSESSSKNKTLSDDHNISSAGFSEITGFGNATWLRLKQGLPISSNRFWHTDPSNLESLALLKSNIIHFGILLLRLFCIRFAPRDDKIFVNWARPLLLQRAFHKLLDEDMKDLDVYEIFRVMCVAAQCINTKLISRSSMSQIISVLKGETSCAMQLSPSSEGNPNMDCSGSSIGKLLCNLTSELSLSE
ncbi:hypothetical protein TEA_008338 [Camellia sinensis var. sinensis]|uniref:Serine-threonine/tyrosine-protein kinase catalytic domain-containing protein n=1 Tax=Camellia sinensis var. sinensis TaxID=542762 RepID=A0A4V6RY61_CAMSN|nr:hypothetical protein TEA_008338 [Camellia sinensis var. sinensis]